MKKPSKKKLQNILDQQWAIEVKERDGYKCVICGSVKLLNSHHIISRGVRELRHDLMNGLTLCVLHHKFSNLISAHTGSFAFNIWLQNNRAEQFKYLEDFLKEQYGIPK